MLERTLTGVGIDLRVSLEIVSPDSENPEVKEWAWVL
jgi:hypothetical protein